MDLFLHFNCKHFFIILSTNLAEFHAQTGFYPFSSRFPLASLRNPWYTTVLPREEVSGVAKQSIKQLASNRKAFHDYFIEDKYEAGIELAGTEVKSVRKGNVNLKDSFCIVKDGEMFLHGMHISPYEQGNIFNKDPRRTRKLLLHKREILKLHAKVQQDGYSLIPLSLYLSGPRVKVELALARGKKLYDKREAAAKRDAKREMDRVSRGRY